MIADTETMMNDDVTGDAVWDKLNRLPYFRQAPMSEKRVMYEEERDRQIEMHKDEERRLREFELRKLELQSEAERQSAASKTTRPAEASHRLKVKLPDWDEQVSIDAYLDVCESLLEGANVPETQWVGHLVPKLPAEARMVYKTLGRTQRNDYGTLKKELLTHFAVSHVVYRQ
jgi:hypothetical protein